MGVGDYINRAGGFTNNANGARIIVKRQDGSLARAEDDTRMLQFGSKKSPIQQGDEILVLPKIDVKSRQIFKEMTQILYQIAYSAGVVLGLRSRTRISGQAGDSRQSALNYQVK